MAAHRKIDVKFHSNGRIDIMANVTRALGIKDGDILDVNLDLETREMYMYIRKKYNCVARYSNAVKSSKGNSRNVRVQSVELASFVNRITNSTESWLYVGEPKFVRKLNCTAIPLIYLNNQYNEQSV